MVDYFHKLGLLIRSPSTFFKTVEKEKNYMTMLLPYAVIFIVVGLFGMLTSLPSLAQEPGMTAVVLVFAAIVSFLLLVGFAFAMPFISAAFAHLGVLVFGGKEGFFNTFKPVVYGSVIGLLYGLLSSLLQLILSPLFPIPANPQTPQEVFRALLNPVLWTSLFIGFVSLVHVLIVQTRGLAKFQKMGYGRAFLSLIFVPLVLIVLAVFIVFFVFVLLLSAA